MKKQSSQSKQALQHAYLKEVMSGLDKMRKALAGLREGSQSRIYLAEIQVIAKSISDLAMIHGFQGVESIARKIYSAIRQHSTKLATSPQFLYKVEAAIQGIGDVVAMERNLEGSMTVESVKIDNKYPPQTQSCLDNLDPEQRKVIEIESKAKLLFDIRENDSLINLTDGLIQREPITGPAAHKQLPS